MGLSVFLTFSSYLFNSYPYWVSLRLFPISFTFFHTGLSLQFSLYVFPSFNLSFLSDLPLLSTDVFINCHRFHLFPFLVISVCWIYVSFLLFDLYFLSDILLLSIEVLVNCFSCQLKVLSFTVIMVIYFLSWLFLVIEFIFLSFFWSLSLVVFDPLVNSCLCYPLSSLSSLSFLDYLWSLSLYSFPSFYLSLSSDLFLLSTDVFVIHCHYHLFSFLVTPVCPFHQIDCFLLAFFLFFQTLIKFT